MPVLVIPHDDYIVGHPSLDVQPVVIVEIEGHIAVHRQDQPALPAQHRELLQELRVMLPALLGQALIVQVDAVQPQPQGGVHHVPRQLLPLCGGGEHLVGADVLARLVLIVEVVPDPPYLEAVSVGPLHIPAVREGAEAPLIVVQAEPRGRDHIDALPLRHHGVQRLVPGLSADGVEAEAHLPRQGQRGVFRRHIVRDRHLHLCGLIVQALVLHIADQGVGGLHLAPGLHPVQQLYLLPLLQLPQDRAFDAAQGTHLGILHHLQHLLLPPLGVHLDMPVEPLVGKVREQPHVLRRHIDLLPLQETGGVLRGVAAAFVRVFPGPERSGHSVLRGGVQELLFRRVHIKAFIQIFLHGIYVKIYRVLPKQRLLLHHPVLQDDGQLPLGHPEILVQIRQLLAVGILVQNHPSEPYQSDYQDQCQRYDYRYYSLLHFQSSPFSQNRCMVPKRLIHHIIFGPLSHYQIFHKSP